MANAAGHRCNWCAPTTAACSGPTASSTHRRRTGWSSATSRRASPTCWTCACAIRCCSRRAATPQSSQALDHWARGVYIMLQLRTPEELQQARQQFQAALALQPDSSHALAGLALTHLVVVVYRWSDQRELELQTGERLARQALVDRSAEPGRDDGFGTDADVQRPHRRGYGGDATASAPESRTTRVSTATWPRSTSSPGDGRMRCGSVDLAIRLSPLDCDARGGLPGHGGKRRCSRCRRYDEAIERAGLILNGPRAGGYRIVASAEAWRGNLDAARAAIGRAC